MTKNGEEKKEVKKEKYSLYGGKIKLEFDPEKHIYFVNDKIVYGVTGITSILSKPALTTWALNLCVSTIRDNYKDIQNENDLERILQLGRQASWKVSKDARELGKRVHQFADDWFSQTPSDKIVAALKTQSDEERFSLLNLTKFLDNTDIKRIFGEKKIYSKKYNYAGTVDFLGNVGNILTVIDWKTSNAIYPSYFLQTAAYAQAIEEEFPQYKVEKTMIVRVGKQEGDLEVEMHTDWQKDLSVFLALKTAYVWSQDVKAKDFDKPKK